MVLHDDKLLCSARHSCNCFPGSSQSRAACRSARNFPHTSVGLRITGLACGHDPLQHWAQLWTCCALPAAGPGSARLHAEMQGTAGKHGARKHFLLRGCCLKCSVQLHLQQMRKQLPASGLYACYKLIILDLSTQCGAAGRVQKRHAL